MISKEELLRTFDYNKELGCLVWINPPLNGKEYLKGEIAGTFGSGGYRFVGYKKRYYKIHHLIWFLETGVWAKVIDHIDGDFSNNRISNLKEISYKEKAERKPFAGCTFRPRMNRWEARISINKNHKILGYFLTKDEAHQRYLKELESK